MPSHPPSHSSEDVDDAGELPPVIILHTGDGGAVGASQLWLPGQHRGAHTHMTYSSAAPTTTTTIKPLFYILTLLMLTMVTPATPCISWWS